MSTDLPHLPTDAQLLYEYLGQRIELGDADRPAADVLADLTAYGEQLERLRRLVDEAETSIADGQARPLDVEALLERVRRRMNASNRAES